MKSISHKPATMLVVILTVFFGLRVITSNAQDKDSLLVGKKGMITFKTEIRAGEATLKPGMYHVRHEMEGEDHVVVFRPVRMPAGYRQSQMNEGREVVRLKCRVEPAPATTRNTKIVVGRNSSGERTIQEVQIAGEKVRHLF